MATRHTDPYVRDREVVREDSSTGPMMLVIGIILAIAIAVGAWFAFNGDAGDGDTTVIQPGTEEVVPDGGTGGDTSGGDTGTTGGDTGTSQ